MEIDPEIREGFDTVGVELTNSKGSFDLGGQVPLHALCRFANEQNVVSLPPEMLGLKRDFIEDAVGQNRRHSADEQKGEIARVDMLLKESAGTPSCHRA